MDLKKAFLISWISYKGIQDEQGKCNVSCINSNWQYVKIFPAKHVENPRAAATFA